MHKEAQAILIAVITLVFLCAILIVLFVVFQKRKNSLILKQKESEKRFEQEISKMQIEIREETFRNISWELHDNIGQLLTLAKIQLQSNANTSEVLFILDKGLKELRALSKSINPDTLKNISLVLAVNQEVERLNRLGFIKATFKVMGEETSLKTDVEIVFFRIIQEFLSNTIKHAKATTLDIILKFGKNELHITAKDNGTGIPKNKANRAGMGLKNIVDRAQLIGAKATITSVENKGTELTIAYIIPDILNTKTQVDETL
ncbi:MAG: sensor histidine kinase [Flavobacteriaceae bacterium]